MQTTSTMTADEIRSKFAEIISNFESKLEVVDHGIINDYPIGVGSLGKCKLQVESLDAQWIWRTVMSTTDEHGRWCEAKKSTAFTGYGFVVTGELVKSEFEWLSISLNGIDFLTATGESRRYFERPFSEGFVRTRDSRVSTGNGVREFKADAPEVVEAWKAYLVGLNTVAKSLQAMKQSAPTMPTMPATETQLWDWTKSNGGHYSKPVPVLEGMGMEALRTMFPDGEADALRFVLFSTSGVHGSYVTIEDSEATGLNEVTFVIVQPRVVAMRYGNVVPKSPEDYAYLKKLRQTSWDAVSKIGKQKESVNG